MNKKKNLILAVVICALVYSIYFTASCIVKGDNDIDGAGSIGSQQNDPQIKFEYQTLSTISPSKIKSFTITKSNQKYSFNKVDNLWYCDHKDGVTDSISISYALNTLADIKIYKGEGITVLDATKENLIACGLDNGFTISLIFEDDTCKTYTVGNYLKFGSAYYFTNGDGNIYTVLNRFTSTFNSLCP